MSGSAEPDAGAEQRSGAAGPRAGVGQHSGSAGPPAGAVSPEATQSDAEAPPVRELRLGDRSVAVNRLPLIAFVIFAVMSVAAFFIVQRLKTANPVVWGNPQPTPSVFNPVAGRTCKVDGQLVDYRRTYLQLSPTNSGRIAVYVYPLDGQTPVATLARARYLRAVPFGGNATSDDRFYWRGRESDGRLAPPGKYSFRFVLLDLGGHAVDLTDHPVTLLTGTQSHGCSA